MSKILQKLWEQLPPSTCFLLALKGILSTTNRRILTCEESLPSQDARLWASTWSKTKLWYKTSQLHQGNQKITLGQCSPEIRGFLALTISRRLPLWPSRQGHLLCKARKRPQRRKKNKKVSKNQNGPVSWANKICYRIQVWLKIKELHLKRGQKLGWLDILRSGMIFQISKLNLKNRWVLTLIRCLNSNQ